MQGWPLIVFVPDLPITGLIWKTIKDKLSFTTIFCGPGHNISDCLVQIIFHVDQDEKDTKDVLLVKEEYCMRMLAILYPFGLNDNVNSLNINLRSYDFKKSNSLNTPYFSYPQSR